MALVAVVVVLYLMWKNHQDPLALGRYIMELTQLEEVHHLGLEDKLRYVLMVVQF